MAQKKVKRSRKTVKGMTLALIEEEKGYTVADIAKEIYGNSDYISRQKIGSTLTSLRKDGIPAYPRTFRGAVVIPSTLDEYKDVLYHIVHETALPVRVVRALSMLLESAMKYPQLAESNTGIIKELGKPVVKAQREMNQLRLKQK